MWHVRWLLFSKILTLFSVYCWLNKSNLSHWMEGSDSFRTLSSFMITWNMLGSTDWMYPKVTIYGINWRHFPAFWDIQEQLKYRISYLLSFHFLFKLLFLVFGHLYVVWRWLWCCTYCKLKNTNCTFFLYKTEIFSMEEVCLYKCNLFPKQEYSIWKKFHTTSETMLIRQHW